jgi:integrase/recombinase XerD
VTDESGNTYYFDDAYSSLEGASNEKNDERPSAKIGRPRGARSMGRYPMVIVAGEYLAKRRGFIAKSTYEEWERKLRYINATLVRLKRQGKVSTTNPEDLTARDVSAYLEWAKGKGIQAATLVKYLCLMAKVCAFAGNPVFERMKAEGEEFPRRTPKDLKSLTRDELKRIHEQAARISGWYGDVCRFIVTIYPYSGLRPSELRLAHLEDLDTKRWRIWIRHPKGEGKYARQRFAPVLPPARQAVLDYLEKRVEHLEQLGVKCAIPLIPAQHGVEIGFYSETRFRSLKKRLELPDIRFSLKTFRDTFCQMNIDLDPTLLSDISVSMGHSTTRTTETHYGRIKNEQALERLQMAWEKKSSEKPTLTVTSAESKMIEKKFDIPGYA